MKISSLSEWSLEAFRTLADFLMSRYGESGTDVMELISAQQQKAAQEGRSISTETAYEEVVADSMETMLTDSNAVEKLIELKKTDSGLFDKLRETVNKFLAAIKSVFSDIVPESEEGKLVMQMQDSYQRLSDLFAEALNRASENYQETGYGDVAGENAEEADIQRSGRAKKEKDPYAKYYGMTDEEFKAAWPRTYSWDELTAKEPIVTRILKRTEPVPMNSDGTVDRQTLSKILGKKLKKVLDENGNPVLYAVVNDIGEGVEVSRKGEKHGFFEVNNDDQSRLANARALMAMPQLLENAIEVNVKNNRSNESIPFSRVLLGTFAVREADGSVTPYIVRMVIEEHADRSDPLKAQNVIGKLKSINAKTAGQVLPPVSTDTGHIANARAVSYTLADVIDSVKGVFQDTFSEDVYDHFGIPRTPPQTTVGKDGKVHENFPVGLLYSTRSTGLDSRTILEGYEPQNDLESRMVGKYLTALEQLRSIENELAGQREALKSLQDASPRDRAAIRTQREAILANENRVTTLTESLARLENRIAAIEQSTFAREIRVLGTWVSTAA